MAGTAGRRGTLSGAQVAALVAVVLVAFGIAIYATRDRKTPENCHYVGAVRQCSSPTPSDADSLGGG